MTLITRLRNNLQPQGTAPLVQIRLRSCAMFNKEFVDKCLDELERMPIRSAMGDGPNNLERLAYEVLMDSAYIDLKHEAEREEQLAQYAKETNEKILASMG
jgi:hypothetical protein